MKVLHVCSELFPLIKTGGLADVMGALPLAQQAKGMNVRVVLPMYPAVAEKIGVTGHVAYFHTFAGHIEIRYADFQGIGVYLIHAPHLYAREGNPYHDVNYHDYHDNYLRFALLAWVGASLAAGADSWWGQVDVLHAHDWQAGLACAYLRAWGLPVKTVFTVHNMAYAGVFDARHLGGIDLPLHFLRTEGLEFYGQMSYLKAGLYYADRITTVSPTYAKEITEEANAYGFHGLLQTRTRENRLSGILNGVDNAVWNPEKDPYLEQTYTRGKMQGKKADKQWLQAAFNLPVKADVSLWVMVTRLVEQKGADILLAAAETLLNHDIQLVVLGSGAPYLEQAFLQLAERYPEKVGVKIAYNEALSHQMIAGGDVILVPSRFEPCGLTQLYGLKYGTLPLVRATGGLADTVIDADKEHLQQGKATGFTFNEATPEALLQAAERLLHLWYQPNQWVSLRAKAMAKDFGWHKVAESYQALYLSI